MRSRDGAAGRVYPDPRGRLRCASGVRAKGDALVDGHEREDGFRNQWGLAKIGAARAYTNIEVLKGAGVELGAGVTLGFLDTGIDWRTRRSPGTR